MKKLLVITIIAVTACMSTTAHAKNGAGWSFLTAFFTGIGTDPTCTDINSDDPLKSAMTIQSMKNKGSMIVDADGAAFVPTK
jgi:hypothetical protein